MNITALKNTILSGGIDSALTEGLSVPAESVPAQRERYASAADAFLAKYGDGDVSLYSVGGRSEISGNHTDHNHGRVIAASVNLDILAVAKPVPGGVIRIQSEGFPDRMRIIFSKAGKLTAGAIESRVDKKRSLSA